MTVTRKGKIARLPRSVREQVNQRLLDGETGSEILPWLNSLPDVKTRLKRHFDGAPITDQNLSEWRAGGFQEWLKDNAQVERIRSLGELSFRIAKASGGNLSAGPLAAAAGRVMETLESLEGEDLNKALAALTLARGQEISAQKLKLQQVRLDQNARALALDEAKFQRTTADLFLKWYDAEEARRIASGKETRTVKMDKLVQLMFGDRPEAGATP